MLNTVRKERDKNNKRYERKLQSYSKRLQLYYATIAEQFKIYLNSLPESEKDEIKKDFCANRNGLLTIRESESALQILDSFSMFCF